MHARAGTTLVELLIAVGMIATLAALSVPTVAGIVARAQTRGALDRFASDATYARMLAVRNGARVELRLLNSGRCPQIKGGRFAADGYHITVRRSPPVLARQLHLPGESGVCLTTSNDSTIVYGGRGLPLPFENRTVWARKGGVADSMTISVLGRILRRY